MPEDTTAQNPVATSPTAAATAPSDPPEQDVTEESSASDASGDSSPAPGAKPKSLADVISKALGSAEDEPEDDKAEASPPEEKAEPAAEADPDEPEATQEEPAKVEKEDAEKFDERSLSAKAQKRFHELANEAKEYRGIVDEFKRYAGDETGWQNMRQLIRNHAENPAEAVPMLELLLDDARKRAGLVIQSDDIKQKLDDGLVDEPTALELEQARMAAQRSKAQAEAQAKTQAQQAQQAMVTALDHWEASVRSRLPDYDSYQSLVRAKVTEAAAKSYPKSPDEAVQMAQAALDDITSWVRQRVNPPQARKVSTSSGSSTKANAKPSSIRDIVNKHFPD